MPRRPKAYWHKENACWASGAGEVSEATGRRKPVYFRGIPRNRPAEARAALDAYLEERESRDQAQPEGFTLGELAGEYLGWLGRRVEAGKARPLTAKGHRAALRKFLAIEWSAGRTMGDRVAADLVATEIGRAIGTLVAAGHSPNYIGRIVGSAQTVLNWAAEPVAGRHPEKLIAENPIKGLRHEATHAPRPPDRYAPESEIRAFVAWGYRRADTYVRVGKRENLRGELIVKGGDLERRFERMTIDLVLVAYLTGTRPGELRVAEWGDFAPRHVEMWGEWYGRILLDPSRWKSGSKTGRPREIILPAEAVETIERIRALPDHHPRFIWTHRRGPRSKDRSDATRAHGEPWTETSLPNKICALRRQAIADGVPIQDKGHDRFVMYRLRHTRAAELLMKGIPVATVATLLGTSIQMIETVYGSFTGGHLAEATARGIGRSPSGPVNPT